MITNINFSKIIQTFRCRASSAFFDYADNRGPLPDRRNRGDADDVVHQPRGGVSSLQTVQPGGRTGGSISGHTAKKQGPDTDIELPAVLYLGIAYKWNDLTLEFDAQWTEWSTYEKLEVRLTSGSTISKWKDWKDVWAYRFGAQYRLNEWLDLRAGIVFDETPIPDDTLDPLVPSGDRWLFACGFGSHYEKWTVDFAYNYVLDEDRTFNNEAGNYGTISGTRVGRLTGEFTDVQVHVFVLNVSYRF